MSTFFFKKNKKADHCACDRNPETVIKKKSFSFYADEVSLRENSSLSKGTYRILSKDDIESSYNFDIVVAAFPYSTPLVGDRYIMSASNSSHVVSSICELYDFDLVALVLRNKILYLCFGDKNKKFSYKNIIKLEPENYLEGINLKLLVMKANRAHSFVTLKNNGLFIGLGGML